MLISPEYLALQKELHAAGNYGTGVQTKDANEWVRKVAPIGSSVLDYGCGQGTLKAALGADYDVREYDPAVEGKTANPDRADYVTCIDVLEHIEPECLDLVINHLKVLTKY